MLKTSKEACQINKSYKSYKSIWDAICDSPEEAFVMKAKSYLLMRLGIAIKSWNVSESEACLCLHIKPKKLKQVLQGKINKISFTKLCKVAYYAQVPIIFETFETKGSNDLGKSKIAKKKIAKNKKI